ncbi:MAG: hypothetical protein ACHQQR_00740 [Gemmatimonadales bacterium]
MDPHRNSRTGDRYAVQCNGVTVATFADQGEATKWKDEQESEQTAPGRAAGPRPTWAVVDLKAKAN